MALSLLARSSNVSSKVLCLLPRSSVCLNYAAQTAVEHRHQQNLRSFSISGVKHQSAVGNHVKLWQAERALSVGLLGIIPIALIAPSQPAEILLATSIVIHFHWGLEAIVTDYVRESLFGKVVPKAAHGLLLLFSAATLAGLIMMAHNDNGIARVVRKIWNIEAK